MPSEKTHKRAPVDTSKSFRLWLRALGACIGGVVAVIGTLGGKDAIVFAGLALVAVKYLFGEKSTQVNPDSVQVPKALKAPSGESLGTSLMNASTSYEPRLTVVVTRQFGAMYHNA